MNDADKKECIKNTIMAQVDLILDGIEKTGNINHFSMMINNHNGTMQVERIQKNRIKAY